MNLIRHIAVAIMASGLASAAFAQTDPAAFTSGSETSTRFNVNATSTTYPAGRPDATTYAPIFVNNNGGTQFRLNQLNLGIRRVGTTAAPAPAVGVEVTVLQMTNVDGVIGFGPQVAIFTRELAASTVAVTEQVSNIWGATDPATRPIVPLETASNGVNGFAGFWVGLRFTGAGSTSSANGWRVAIEPVVGRCSNTFGINDPVNLVSGTNYYFGTTTGTDGVVRENMARFVVGVSGLVTDSVAPPANFLYGQTFAVGGYWKPTDANDGVGSQWFYMSNFLPATAGQVYRASKVSLSVYRGGSIAVPATAIGVQLALVRMNWDGTAYTPGTQVATTTVQLAETTAAGAVRVNWNIPAGEATVPLNTDNAANVGFGGYYVAARFLGDATALLGANGPQLAMFPQIGASFNSFGLYSTAVPPVFGNYTFGQYNWQMTGTTTYYVKPSRFVVDAFGAVGSSAPPCPADLNTDGVVNGADLGLMLGAWGVCPAPCSADLNADGVVNGADLGLMLGAWGACPV